MMFITSVIQTHTHKKRNMFTLVKQIDKNRDIFFFFSYNIKMQANKNFLKLHVIVAINNKILMKQ